MDQSQAEELRLANKYRMWHGRLLERDCLIMGGKKWILTSRAETDAIGEASKGDEDGAGDKASGTQGKKSRAKRQRVFANNASIVSYLPNIEVREGNAGGWSY